MTGVLPSAAASDLAPGRPLPRGRHAAPRAVVRRSQRDRLLAAVADAVSDQGYAATAVADVVARAGVSRKTFYEHFANKEECFLAAYDAGVDVLIASIESAARAAEAGPPAALDAAVRRYLEALAGNPAFARTFLVEILAAGPTALEHRRAVLERFAAMLVGVHGASGETVAPALYQACVGAVHELVTEALLRDGAGGRPAMREPVLDVIVALLLGRTPARAG
jgi:AcrR family transcriptional regulator